MKYIIMHNGVSKMINLYKSLFFIIDLKNKPINSGIKTYSINMILVPTCAKFLNL